MNSLKRPVELGQRYPGKYLSKLRHLKEMGFDNEEENLKALKKFNGDLERTIENLILKM
ncbi:hypothetical protein C1646_685772 [Rhizophagus diaphanus]|nr:hypothetical protein C1646_685772 [Rhizophagus diaphanus] [Rhizophagus sp. MUCL 43196]